MRPITYALVAISLAVSIQAWAEDVKPVSGIAIYGEPKYKDGFAHFDYVNPNAPKGGELRQAELGAFDNLNPFIVKGNAAGPASLPFETLLTSPADEPFTEYGLIAKSVEFPSDRSWEIF